MFHSSNYSIYFKKCVLTAYTKNIGQVLHGPKWDLTNTTLLSFEKYPSKTGTFLKCEYFNNLDHYNRLQNVVQNQADAIFSLVGCKLSKKVFANSVPYTTRKWNTTFFFWRNKVRDALTLQGPVVIIYTTHTSTLDSPKRLYLCASFVSHSKLRPFP
jgi:hypothetical protein